MRPVLAVLIWIVLIGGLTAYMHYREGARPLAAYRVQDAGGVFSLDVATTFVAEPDPFALSSAGNEPVSLLVRLNGKEIVRKTDRIEPGALLRVDPVEGIGEGENEFYLEANPPVAAASPYQAVRVQVRRDGQVVGEHSSWSESGARISDTFRLHIDAGPREEHANGR